MGRIECESFGFDCVDFADAFEVRGPFERLESVTKFRRGCRSHAIWARATLQRAITIGGVDAALKEIALVANGSGARSLHASRRGAGGTGRTGLARRIDLEQPHWP